MSFEISSSSDSKSKPGGRKLSLFGVVEGFYNRPWSHDQRLDLFDKMRDLDGLNCYLYAPKDDHKHRAMWRDPYDEAERKELGALITACRERGILFFYGISPGLDMRYSRDKDLQDLKSKCDDLKALGCEAFALLWDDIDTTLPEEDRGAFETLAQAHVKITNALYNHLGRPEFLTCPVEYCANRADPNVKQSEYLNTLGSGLHPDIGVFWTGSKVVPEFITKDEIVFLNTVLKRKAIIWDNLHANDYDHQRLFLGPYAGRDAATIPHLGGVMINPNCEYSFNVPALVTLSIWAKSFDAESGTVKPYDPIAAADAAVPHFIKEFKRSTSLSVHSQGGLKEKAELGKDQTEINKADVQLLFHIFWLPHSNGPSAEMLANDFKYLRDHAHVILEMHKKHQHRLAALAMKAKKPKASNGDKTGNDDSETSSDDEDMMGESVQQEFFDSWMERASSFNNVCKRFSHLCDKMTYIENRQLFFDLNTYLNNVQVTLSGCNRFLKWVGLDRCRKPITGGPTLSGLSGGFAGEMMRLYPVRTNYEYPLRSLRPMAEKFGHVLRPVSIISEIEKTKLDLPRYWLVEDEKIGKYAIRTKLTAFVEADPSEWRCIAIDTDHDDALSGFVVGTRAVRKACERLESMQKEMLNSPTTSKTDDCYSPVVLPSSSENIPWKMFEKYEAILSLIAATDLLFTKSLANAVKLLLISLNDAKSAAIMVEKRAPLTRQFLKTHLDFKEIHRSKSYEILVWTKPELSEERMDLS